MQSYQSTRNVHVINQSPTTIPPPKKKKLSEIGNGYDEPQKSAHNFNSTSRSRRQVAVFGVFAMSCLCSCAVELMLMMIDDLPAAAAIRPFALIL
jgi:hypothetical protein